MDALRRKKEPIYTYSDNVNIVTKGGKYLYSYILGLVKNNTNTLQPLYNMVHYNTVLDITRFKDGSQKCIDYIEK